MQMAKELSKLQLQAILFAAKTAGLDAANLTAENPYLLQTPTSRSLRAALESRFPREAQELQISADVPLSLAAVAWEQGLSEMDEKVRKELASKRPALLQEIDARNRQAFIAEFEEQYAAKVEALEQDKIDRAHSNASAQFQSIQLAAARLKR